MHSHQNSQQLVLRVDSATGFAQVGWAADLPMGRFIHIEIVGESSCCGPISSESPLYSAFQQACRQAIGINQPLVAAQKRSLMAKGCLPVPLDLNDSNALTVPDAFGSFHEAAMGALFRLTANFSSVWAVIKDHTVSQVHSCRPPKTMGELEYQVWERYILKKLTQYPGDITTGKLIVQESGLWFCPQQ
ncbi:hypothetical protein [Kaarinaea lacus]